MAALLASVGVVAWAGVGLGPWPSAEPKLDGDATWPAGARPAPGFRLFDQTGHAVTVRSERGHTVLLTFLYSHCRELCPAIGAELTQIQRALPPDQQPRLLVVSVDPGGDTPASVRAFAANEGWSGHWQWLLGTRRELTPVWRKYGIEVKPGRRDIAHSGAAYLIDPSGHERSGYVAPFLVQDVAADLRVLSGRETRSRSIALVAGLAIGVVAVAVLILLIPWARRPRVWVGQMARRRRVWAGCAGVVFVATAAAFLFRPATSAPQVAGDLIPDSARRPAPSLAGGATLIPPRVVLAAERGRIVYVNFWASWCIPCRQEAPALRSFAHSLGPRHALFVGVNVSDKQADALAFIRRYRLTYPSLTDTKQMISRRYDVLGLPTTVAIDPSGRIAVELLGPQTLAELRATFKRLSRR